MTALVVVDATLDDDNRCIVLVADFELFDFIEDLLSIEPVGSAQVGKLSQCIFRLLSLLRSSSETY